MADPIIDCPNCGRRNRVPPIATGVPTCGNCHRPLPWIAEAGDDSFAGVVEQATMPVLVDFWAAWCGPCRKVSPALEQVARERAGELKLVKIDCDTAPKLVERFSVQAVPTLLVMHNGQILSRQAGAPRLDGLRRWVDQALGRSP